MPSKSLSILYLPDVKITLGQYFPGDSFVHRLDPRVKILLMGLGIGVAFHVQTIKGVSLLALYCFLATFASYIPLKRLMQGIRPFLWLFGFTAVLHIFMTPGDPVAWLPYATQQGIYRGLLVGLQLIYAIWLSTLMTLTTSPLDMVGALEWFLSPLKYFKVPIEDIALLVMLAIRFVPLMFDETDRILKAQKARGVDLEAGGLIRRLRALLPVLIPLLQGMFRRADDLAVALTLRGYSPGLKRSRSREITIRTSDIMVLLVNSMLLLVLIWF
jgi:energy-coupling factor transport system permease protein